MTSTCDVYKAIVVRVIFKNFRLYFLLRHDIFNYLASMPPFLNNTFDCTLIIVYLEIVS